MSQEAVERLLDRWMNDAAFRERLREDPEGAIGATGESLSEDEWAALRSVDFSLSDEDLQARVSRGS